MSGEEKMRFSDTELKELRELVETHINGEDGWREKQDRWMSEQDNRWESLLTVTESNTRAVGSLIEETRDIVQLHRDLQGAARVGERVQVFMLWLVKFGVVGGALAAALQYALDHTRL